MLNEKVGEILKDLELALKELKKRQGLSKEDYIKSRELQDIIEREFEKALQDCIDIGARIIAEKGFRTADTDVEVFEVLYEENVLPQKLYERMRELAGFRNILVHIYRKINHNEVLRHLKGSLNYIEEFSQLIRSYLEKINS